MIVTQTRARMLLTHTHMQRDTRRSKVVATASSLLLLLLTTLISLLVALDYDTLVPILGLPPLPQ